MQSLNYKNFISNSFDGKLKCLQNYLKCVEKPKIVFFNKSIDSLSVNHPNTTEAGTDIEVEYHKNNNKNQYLIRYDGKIRPCMISLDNKLYSNYLYYKLSDDHKFLVLDDRGDLVSSIKILDVFNKYIQTKFKPLYPSVNYFAVDKITSINYNEPNILPYLTGMDQDKKESVTEYNWYNSSKVFSLWSKLELDIVLYKNSIEDVIIDDDTDYYENY